MTINPQNRIQHNTHWPDINSSTISFLPTILPPQIQETQMQLSSKLLPITSTSATTVSRNKLHKQQRQRSTHTKNDIIQRRGRRNRKITITNDK
jgi:hypothetical protein